MLRIFSRVPLALLNLTHDKRRLVVCVLGVAFAVFLMFAQMGFQNAMLDGSVALIRQFNGELVIVSKARTALVSKEPFTRRRLEQARSVPGVRAAYPVYLDYFSYWKDRFAPAEETTNSNPIRIIAFDPDQPVLDNQAVRAQQGDLKIPFNILLDRKSKREFGKIQVGVEQELGQHAVRVAGVFTLGTDFASNGNVIMSDMTYARMAPGGAGPNAVLALVDVGVVRLEDGADPEEVRRDLERTLPDDVAVLTRDDFAAAEMRYWKRSTPIGFVFQFGLVMGFIVGAVICYQIISTDVSDHLAEFATLKAIGYQDGYLNQTVLRETLWLSVLGFLPGLALSWILYRTLDLWVGLPMRLTPWRVLAILGLTTLMCVLSGLVALRKVKSADPAEVF
jgi:putative ABC transport system permease protein